MAPVWFSWLRVGKEHFFSLPPSPNGCPALSISSCLQELLPRASVSYSCVTTHPKLMGLDDKLGFAISWKGLLTQTKLTQGLQEAGGLGDSQAWDGLTEAVL